MWGKQVMIRIYVSITLTVMFIVVITGFFYYNHSRNALLNEGSALIREILYKIDTSIELMVVNILDISKQVHDNQALYSHMASEFPLSHASFSFLVRELDRLMNSNRFVDSATFYLDTSGRVVHWDYGAAPAELFIDDRFLEWFRSDRPDITVINTHPVARGLDRHVFSVWVRMPFVDSRNPIGALIINVDQANVYRNIIARHGTGILFYVVDQDAQVIFSHDESQLYQNLAAIPHLSNIALDSAVNQIVNIDGSPYLVVALPSGIQRYGMRDWTYIMAYPIYQINATINNIRFMVLMVGALTLVVGSFVIFLLFSRVFGKYDEVFSLITSKAAVYKTASGNVKEDILLLLSDRERIQQQWDTLVPLFKDKFYLSLVMQRHDKKAIFEQAEHLGLSLPDKDWIFSVLEIDDSGLTTGHDYLESLSVTGIIESVMSAGSSEYFCVETSPKRVVLAAAIDMEALLLLLHEIINQISDLQMAVIVGVCDIPYGIEALYQAYEQALQTIRYKIIFGINKIILYSDIKSDAQAAYLYPSDKDETLRTLIRAGKADKAVGLLNDMFEQLSSRRSYFAAQQFIFRLNATVMELMEELSVDKSTLNNLPDQVDLQSFEQPQDLLTHFESITWLLVEHAQRSSNSKTDKYYQAISDYIHENYARDLCIEQLCGFVKLSPTYVNQILKKYCGRPFVQYLNDYRIEQSCVLLKDSEMKVKDISEQVGFHSAKYFIQVFKANKGLTPGEYRKQL